MSIRAQLAPRVLNRFGETDERAACPVRQTLGQTAKFRQTAPEIGVRPGFAKPFRPAFPKKVKHPHFARRETCRRSHILKGRRRHSMLDNADPIAPEDRPATQRDVATAIAAAEERIVDRLTEVMRED